MSTGWWILAIAASILITWFLARKELFVRNGWKLIYTVLIVLAFLALLNFGKECARLVFQPKMAELKIIQAQGEIQKGEIAGVESYKATYELFNSQFSQLLVILGFFGTLFGIVLPVGAYLLQRQSLRDEREGIDTRIKKVEEEIDLNLQRLKDERQSIEKLFEKRIEEVHSEIEKKITKVFEGQYRATASTFDAASVLFFGNIAKIEETEDKITVLCNCLVAWDSSINFAIKGKDRKLACDIIRKIQKGLPMLEKHCSNELRAAFKRLTLADQRDDNFLSGKDISDFLGVENRELFDFYKKLYEPMIPWKFQ